MNVSSFHQVREGPIKENQEMVDNRSKEKLIYVLPKYSHDIGEHFYHNYELLEELGKRLDILWLIEKGTEPLNPENIQEIHALKNQGEGAGVKKFFEFLWILIKARARGYKKLYTHYSHFSGILGSLLMKLTGGTSYYWHCGWVGLFKKPFSLNPSILFGKFGKIRTELPLWLTLELVDNFVTGTKRMGEHYVEHYHVSPRKIRIMPNWINLERFNLSLFDKMSARRELGLEENGRFVTFVHRLTDYRGTDVIVPMAKEVCRKLPDVKFIIAGDGPDRQKLEEEVKANRLNDRILILGAVPNRDIPKLLAASDLFIMPSRADGFPRVLLETMAMGIPFVSTDVGGIRDFVSHSQSEWLVPTDACDLSGEFVSRITRLLEDPNLYETRMKEGLQKVKDYQLERVAKIFHELVTR